MYVNGRVGIGCNSPANALDVVGRIRVSSSNNSGISLRDITFPAYERSGDIAMNTISSGATSWMSLQANGTGTFRIYEGGGIFIQPQVTNVAISILGGAAFGLIQLQGNGVGIGAETGIYSKDCLVSGVDPQSGWYYGQSPFTGATLGNFIIRRVNAGGNAATPAIQITPSGTTTFGATVTAPDFVATSDKTLKENIVDARINYLDDLNKLRLVNYNRIGKTKKELGFIAQEVEEVFPSIVEKNGYDDKKGYSITALIPMLVSAVQSLSKTVSSLQGQIDEIKSASNPITP